jgi:hypothetical protein
MIRPDLLTSAISLNDGNTTGLDFSAAELARIGATTDFSSITIGGATHTGALGVGDWTVGSDLSLSAGSIALGGNVNAGANTLNATANSTDITYASGTLSADSLNLDAQGTMTADVNIATALDIAANSTAATLTGLFQAGNTQTEADLITGGPGNDLNYTFEGYTIREIVAAAGGGGGGGGIAPTPTPVVPDAPTLAPSAEVNETPSAEAVPLPATITLPNTFVMVSQDPMQKPFGNSYEEKKARERVSILDGKITIAPELIELLGLNKDELPL